jgi:hypothetical protein
VKARTYRRCDCGLNYSGPRQRAEAAAPRLGFRSWRVQCSAWLQLAAGCAFQLVTFVPRHTPEMKTQLWLYVMRPRLHHRHRVKCLVPFLAPALLRSFSNLTSLLTTSPPCLLQGRARTVPHVSSSERARRRWMGTELGTNMTAHGRLTVNRASLSYLARSR